MMFKSFLHNRELNIEVFIIYIKKSIDIVIDFDSGTQWMVFLHITFISMIDQLQLKCHCVKIQNEWCVDYLCATTQCTH